MNNAINTSDASDGFWLSKTKHCVDECPFYIDEVTLISNPVSSVELECVGVCPTDTSNNKPYVKFLRTNSKSKHLYSC
jgi:hypothetical protein